MKYFMVAGNLKTSEPIENNIMQEHMAYSGKAMENGLILMTGIKEDMSGVIFVMKAEKSESVEEYLSHEPLKINGIQEYKFIEFSPHYFNPSPEKWFNK